MTPDAYIDSSALIAVITFIFGAIVGSFLNVCIARIPNGESVVRPPSHCPKCKRSIAFYDNIPIVSYLILLGRCRSCGERISPRYLFVEVLTGSVAVALYYQFNLSFAFFVGFIFLAALVVITFIDLDVRIIPDAISLPGIATGLLFSLAGKYLIADASNFIPTPVNSIVGILAGYGFLWAVAWIYERCTGVEGMGGGDMKLLAMFGAFLGWQSLPFTLFFGSLVGSVIGLGIMFATGADRRLPIPFGPFLCFGATVHLFFGRELVAFYFN